MTFPKMKFLRRVGMRVNGMQNTVSNRSLIERLRRNTLVTVLILFCLARVTMTKLLPTKDKRKIILYNVIRNSPLKSGDLLSVLSLSFSELSFTIVVR